MYGAHNYQDAGFTPPAPPTSVRTVRRATVVLGLCFVSLLLTKHGTSPRRMAALNRVKPYVRAMSASGQATYAMPDVVLDKAGAYSALARTLHNNTESSEFLNDMCAVMWPYIGRATGAMVRDLIEPMFADMLPGMLKKTRFLSIDLGDVPMQFDRIDVMNRSADSVRLHIDTLWDGRVNIQLKSPMVGRYGVSRIGLRGRVSMLMKPLVSVLPVVSAMQIGYINPPSIEMDFSGMANIADNSLLRGRVMDVFNEVFASLFVLPNRMLVPLLPGNDFFSTYELPIGVLKLTLLQGQGFKTNGGLFRDVPDMYVKMVVGGEKVQKSKVVKNSKTPEWGETFDFIYSDAEQLVRFSAYDEDLDKDDFMGAASVRAYELLQEGAGGIEVRLRDKGKELKSSLTVKSEVMRLSSDRTNFDASMANDDEIVGLLSVVVAGASNITESKNLATYARVYVGEREFVTAVVKKMVGVDPTMPQYNAIFNVALSRALFEEQPTIKLQLYKGEDKLGESVVEVKEVMSEKEMKWRRDLRMQTEGVLQVLVQLCSLRRN